MPKRPKATGHRQQPKGRKPEGNSSKPKGQGQEGTQRQQANTQRQQQAKGRQHLVKEPKRQRQQAKGNRPKPKVQSWQMARGYIYKSSKSQRHLRLAGSLPLSLAIKERGKVPLGFNKALKKIFFCNAFKFKKLVLLLPAQRAIFFVLCFVLCFVVRYLFQAAFSKPREVAIRH